MLVGNANNNLDTQEKMKDNSLFISIGSDNGRAILHELSRYNLFIYGDRAASYLECLNHAINANTKPKEVRTIIIGSGSYCTACDDPHLLTPLINTDKQSEEQEFALGWLDEEYRKRTRLFSSRGVSSFTEYNGCVRDEDKLFRIVVFVHESITISSNLSLTSDTFVPKYGIHFIVGTKAKPWENTIIMSHISNKLALRTLDPNDSARFLGIERCESLNYDEALYQSEPNGDVKRIILNKISYRQVKEIEKRNTRHYGSPNYHNELVEEIERGKREVGLSIDDLYPKVVEYIASLKKTGDLYRNDSPKTIEKYGKIIVMLRLKERYRINHQLAEKIYFMLKKDEIL